jgi:hypothetical protein
MENGNLIFQETIALEYKDLALFLFLVIYGKSLPQVQR